jgi:hypothetical protein
VCGFFSKNPLIPKGWSDRETNGSFDRHNRPSGTICDFLDNEWWANSDCSQMKKDTSLATARKSAD